MELLKDNPSMNDLIQKLNEVVENINGSLPNTKNELSEIKKLISFGSDTLAGRLNAKLWYFKTQELMTASTELCEGDSCFVLKDGATTGNGTFEYWYIHKTNDVKDIIDSYVDLANSDLVAVKLQDMSLKDVKDTLSAQITKQVGDLSEKVATLTNDIKNSLGKKADLVDGLVPSSQLPSYVDDVIESWLKDEEFPKNAYAKEDTEMTTPITPEESKIYVNLLNNKTYRWGGNFYVEVSKSLAIGETSTTAFAGDRGKNLEEKVDYFSNYVTPEMFGATGDGVTDDTKSLQKTFNYAINNRLNVFIPSGTYLFDTITFPNNQDGLVIKGCGKWKTKFKSINDTSQIVFNDFLRYDISEISFEGNITATLPLLNIIGTAHLSIFHDCIFRVNYGVLVQTSAYMSFYDCSFVVLGTESCKFLLKCCGEYFYVRNCYFEGLQTSLDSIGVILSDIHEVYIQNSDICNFFEGTGLLVQPEGTGGAYNIFIATTTFVRSKTCIALDCSFAIMNFNIDITVLDESKIQKIINLYRKDNKVGILSGINGKIATRGNLNEDTELIAGTLYFGQNKIELYNYSTNICKYAASTPIFPKLLNNNLQNSSLAISGTSNIVKVELSKNSPFRDFNLPTLSYEVNNGADPTKIELYNTYGGSFGIIATYPDDVTNPFTGIWYRLN